LSTGANNKVRRLSRPRDTLLELDAAP
jgi:hypothetical protein